MHSLNIKRDAIYSFWFDDSNWTNLKFPFHNEPHCDQFLHMMRTAIFHVIQIFINVFWFQFHCELHFRLFSQFSVIWQFFGRKDSRSFYGKDLLQTILEKKHQPKLLHFDYFTKTIPDSILLISVKRSRPSSRFCAHYLRISFDRPNAETEHIPSDSENIKTFEFLLSNAWQLFENKQCIWILFNINIKFICIIFAEKSSNNNCQHIWIWCWIWFWNKRSGLAVYGTCSPALNWGSVR